MDKPSYLKKTLAKIEEFGFSIRSHRHFWYLSTKLKSFA